MPIVSTVSLFTDLTDTDSIVLLIEGSYDRFNDLFWRRSALLALRVAFT